MFSAVAGMASMFGRKRKEETQTAVLEDIYGDLQQIKTSFKITIVPASEEREKEFDKEKRHQELLAAFRRAGLAMSRAALLGKDDDKDKKGNWLTRLATTYFSYRILKGFIKRFFKIMRLGRLWVLLRGLGFLLVRLFWPLAVAAALIWVIPKIIENWPAILQTVKDTVNGIWDTIKGWLSFLGIDFEEDVDEGDMGQDDTLGEENEALNFTPMWVESSPGKGTWIVNGTSLPGLGKNDKEKAMSMAAAMRAGNSITDMQAAMGTDAIVPQQNLVGMDAAEISGVDNNQIVTSPIVGASGFQHDDSGVADTSIVGASGFQHDDSGIGDDSGIIDTPDIVQPQNTFTPFKSAAAERGRGGQINQNRMTRGNYNVANYQKQAAMDWDEKYDPLFGSNEVIQSTATAQQNLDTLGVTGTWTPLYSKDHARYSDDKGSWKVRSSDLKGKQNANWARINKEKPLTTGMVENQQATKIRHQELEDKRKKFWAGQKAAQEQRMPTVPGQLIPKVTVVNNPPVVVDSSVTQTSANSSRATNKDHGTSNPFMGLYVSPDGGSG